MQLITLLIAPALASVAPECEGLAKPEDYDEQVQSDFLNNYPALSTTLSPIHAPLPHRAGRGAVGADLLLIPPLGCRQRYVLDWTKTEDPNVTPVAPRPRLTFAFQPLLGRIFPYAGLGFVPPVAMGGTRSTVASAELGAGTWLGAHLQVGLRGHATLQRTVGDVAAAFSEDEPAYDDLYLASSSGADLSLGWELERTRARLTPYLSAGVTEVSTYFWVGDDGYVSNNLHPYLGPALSAGVDALFLERLRASGELYAAPGGYSLPDPGAPSDAPAAAYGSLLTARLRLAYEL
jgi:hypothetical protein